MAEQTATEPLWTGAEIARALDITPPAVDVAVSGISIDSRTVERGDLFVAIKGERSDGHRFITAAFDNGAAGALVSRDYAPQVPLAPDEPLFRVNDPFTALEELGRVARARTDARIAAVTGSVGKTTTKEMLRAMLAESGPTHASVKSYNNFMGVPLSLARMPASSRFGVFEIGMNHASEIVPLTKLVRPNVAIVTWVAPVHIEFFASEAEIARAKAEIFEGLEQGGAAILPADNPHFESLAAFAREKSARVVPFGQSPKAEARLVSFERTEEGSVVTADIFDQPVTFALAAPGRHLAQNAVAALAGVSLLGGDVEAASASLARFEVPEGRGRSASFETPQGALLVIDESYNANPASMRAALDVLGQVSPTRYRRRIAVLGDMLELGHDAPQFHASLASAVDSNGIDLVFCAGPLMANLHENLPAGKRGGWASVSEDLREAVLDAVRGGDAVMIKGSLGSRMGPIAEALRTRFASLNG
jgi:UDP-N-acetylmuramoyl-tripeptide--D-alanyl-D-alanine ligase